MPGLLSSIMFGTEGSMLIVMACLTILGYWGIFKKAGVPAWHALIPAFREYELARCADRAQEGRVLYITKLAVILLEVLRVLAAPGENVLVLMLGLNAMLTIVGYIYDIRVFLGLCELFGQRKRWTVLRVFGLTFIPVILWGWRKRYQPLWKVEDLHGAVDDFFSGVQADVMDEGLTVNLEERTARDLFQTKYLLKDIHMYIKPGSMVLLLGGSGAGKTTFLNAVNGYEKARAEIILNGSNVYKDYKKMQYEVGFVPQQDLMRTSDTVLHTLLDSAALRLPKSFNAADRRKRVNEVMEIFGLLPVQNSMVDKLSGGQRKRLSIAMEFISNPSLFILDEPDSGLDGVMARELMQQLRHIADQGKIIIVITHTPDRVIDLFDDVIVLAKDAHRTGRLAFYGSIDDARSFFGKERMEQVVMSINRKEEGGEGRADEFIKRYAEVQHG